MAPAGTVPHNASPITVQAARLTTHLQSEDVGTGQPEGLWHMRHDTASIGRASPDGDRASGRRK